MVIVSYLAFAFLSTSNGYINNSLLAAFGAKPIDWYNSPKYWPFILVLSLIHIFYITEALPAAAEGK